MPDSRHDEPCEAFMSRALVLARRGIEHVSPNPMVGAVLVRGGRIIGEGFHRRYGGPHAEVEALRRARDPRGADLYVTLEPCAHQGKTPPCTDAILRARIRRVFYGAADPNPVTAGRGPGILRAGGVMVHRGCLGEECADLNAPFSHWIRTGRPWVILKWAMSLDGKTATAGGESRWITGERAREYAHRLRRRVDGILIGTSTALRDDPLLTPRPARGRAPARIVLDLNGRLPLRLRLLSAPSVAGEGARIYVTSRRAPHRRRKLLQPRGIQVLYWPADRRGSPDPSGGLRALLEELGAMGISQLLVEGGGTLAGSFLDAGHVDEVAAFIAPRILGGAEARGPVEGRGVWRLLSSPWLLCPSVRRLGSDILVSGRVSGGVSGRLSATVCDRVSGKVRRP